MAPWVNTLPNTPESASSGAGTARCADAQGTLAVPRITTGIGGVAFAGNPATYRAANSAATPCQHIIESTLAGIARASVRAAHSAVIALDLIRAFRSRLDRLGRLEAG